MNRVFVLGAGVSASCGIPVTKGIFVPVMTRLKRTRPNDFNVVVSLVRYLYPHFRSSAETYPHFEEFFAQLEMAGHFNSNRFVTSTLWPQARIRKAENILKLGLADYLWQFTGKPTSRISSIVDFVRGTLRAEDVIVTFNWDLTLERANTLCEQDGPFDLDYSGQGSASGRAKNGRRIHLLKPHGSIDWFTEQQARSVGNAGPNDFVRVGPGLMAYNHFRLVAHHHLSAQVPAVVAPSPFKEFRLRAFRDIWRAVFRSMRKAEAIYFLGYSLPREDQFARFVLRRAFRLIARANTRPNIIVVNPDETARETFTRLVGPELKLLFKQMTFERWLRSTR